MKTTRLEAFSDGVLAIVITVMVLEMKVPKGTDSSALRPMLPVLGSYVMSFIYVGIYWNNHHNLLQTTDRINGAALWANLHLLFWLSLVPFVTGWMGANEFAELPTALYGVVLLCAALSWRILQSVLASSDNRNLRLKEALGDDLKGKISIALYVAAIGLAFVLAWAAIGIYVLVAVIWFVPDRRFERAVEVDVVE